MVNSFWLQNKCFDSPKMMPQPTLISAGLAGQNCVLYFHFELRWDAAIIQWFQALVLEIQFEIRSVFI